MAYKFNPFTGTLDAVGTGSAGASAFVYIAYASDDVGTGFTQTFDPALNYIAILHTTVAIPVPAASDFAGLWKYYNGNGVSVASGVTFTPAGGIAAVNVQTALEELDSEKADASATTSALAGKQPLDSDLTTISGLTATTDNFMQAKSSAWASRTIAQVKTDLGISNVDNTSDANKPVSTATQTALDLKQNLDSDLTTLAGLTATTDNFIQSKSSAWASRTIAQVKTDLGISNVDNTSDANKPVSTATQTALDAKQPLDSDLTTIAGLTATTDNFIQSKGSAWASRTVAQVKTDLAITNIDNTSDANKPISTATQAALDLKQPLDADLTTIAGLTATTDSFMQAKGSAWAARTIAQVKTDLGLTGTNSGDQTAATVSNAPAGNISSTDVQAAINELDSEKQPLDADLTTIAGLTATTDNFMQAKGSAWASRTIAQVKTDLAITNVDNTSDANKPVSTATQAALDLKQNLDADLTTIAGLTATTDSFMQSKSSAWAARTIAQVKTDLGLTGTNSGDQTITLGGDLSGSGTGALTATIVNDAVTYAKMQNVTATNKILGRATAGAGDVEEIALGNGFVYTATTLQSQITRLAKTSTYSVLSTDVGKLLELDPTAGIFTLNLPAPADGFFFSAMDLSGVIQDNPVTLHRFGSEKIQGLAADYTLEANWGSWKIYSDGTDYKLL